MKAFFAALAAALALVACAPCPEGDKQCLAEVEARLEAERQRREEIERWRHDREVRDKMIRGLIN